MSKFKIVRNKVPEEFNKFHGYPMELQDPSYMNSEVNRRFIAVAKLNEEVGELIEATYRGDMQSYYEEAADVYESVLALLKGVDSVSPQPEEVLKAEIARKRDKLGDMMDLTVARISLEEKQFYYNNKDKDNE